MWGQAFRFLVYPVSDRIIPTRVGTSYYILQVFWLSWDHPHACGDKTVFFLNHFLGEGSSPRVWGQAKAPGGVVIAKRIIPTRVGTSDTFSSDTPQGRDHPHACGDKVSVDVFFCVPVGSSPRVWGQEPCDLCSHFGARIIPTRVGTRRKHWQMIA